MKRIDTATARFQPGDPATRKPGTIVPAWFLNNVQEEIASAIEKAGIALNDNSTEQLHAAIVAIAGATAHAWQDIIDKPAQATRWPAWGEVSEKPTTFAPASHTHVIADVTGLQAALANIPKVFSITALPTSNVGPIFVLEAEELWVWVSTPYYTGYRSSLCGRPVYGHTVAPLPSEIDAVGGLLSKTAYAGLWAYAQENSLVVTAAQWSADIGAHSFVDVSDTQFRVPDLRNQFLRYTGTDADNANERTLGSWQADALRSHTHNGKVLAGLTGSGTYGMRAWSEPVGDNHINVVAPNGGTETRPVNTAYVPRIHV